MKRSDELIHIVQHLMAAYSERRYGSMGELFAPDAMWLVDAAGRPVPAAQICAQAQAQFSFSIRQGRYDVAFLDDHVACVSGVLDATAEESGVEISLCVTVAARLHGAGWLIERAYGPFLVNQQPVAQTDEMQNLSNRIGKTFDIRQYGDNLTGILNMEGLAQAVEQVRESERKAAYAFVSFVVDNMGVINQTCGHGQGDELLRDVAAHLRDGCGEMEVCSRIHGDNFAIYLQYTDRESLERRLRRLCEHLVSPELRKELPSPVTFSVGIYLTELDSRESVRVMLDRANLALRSMTRKENANRYCYFNKEMNAEQEREASILAMAPMALENQEFQLYIQPKIDLKTRTVVSGEALVRWFPPNGTLAGPNLFIPVFEQSGLILDLDFYMLRLLCGTMRAWADEGLRLLPISINQSRTHIKDPDYMDKFRRVVDYYGIPHDCLSFELTESAFVKENESMRQLAQDLHVSGFRLEMDDFGTGFASTNLLSLLPMDVIKVDRSLLQGIEERDGRGRKVLEKIIEMAHETNMSVVCEGVETEGQLQVLDELHCDTIQGFCFYKPMPAEEFARRFLRGTPAGGHTGAVVEAQQEEMEGSNGFFDK